MSIANAEGMAPLVFLHLAQADLLGAAPSAIVDALRTMSQEVLIANLKIRRTQEEVVSELTRRGIPVITLKGVNLAMRLYHQIGLRPVGDIDLAAARADITPIDRALVDIGFRRLQGKSRLWNINALLNADLTYLAPNGVKLELHWELTHQPCYRAGLSPQLMLQNAIEERVHGQRHRTLNPTDELQFLCVHCAADHRAARTGFRMIWLVDIALHVSSLPANFDWMAFANNSTRLGLATPILLALEACHEYFDLPTPPKAIERLRAAAATQAEREAWQTAHALATSDTDSMLAYFNSLHGAMERVAFARGVFLPSPMWIRAHYRPQDDSSAGVGRLLMGYTFHYRRLLRQFMGTVEPARP
jgi:hypothetical protein